MEYPTMKLMFENENPISVFEVGCANGGLLKDITLKYPNIEVGGLDTNLSDLVRAKSLFPKYTENFILGDIRYTEIPKHYNIIFTCGTLMMIATNILPLIEKMRKSSRAVFIAEMHDDIQDEWGTNTDLVEGDIKLSKDSDNGSTINTRITRNYKKVFEKLGIPFEHLGHVAGKDIFKI